MIIKKILCAVLITVIFAMGLISCGEPAGEIAIPEGLQLARGGAHDGYYFFAPERWTVANLGNIGSAYASTIDVSSVSYTEAPMPEGTVQEYFEASLADFPTPPTVLVNGEATTFGNAESAVKYVYDYEYSEHKFRIMQIFTSFEGRFGIFTYTSFDEIISFENTQYEHHLESVQKAIESFKYVSRVDAPAVDEKKTVDEDGYVLRSDKVVAGFSLYLPESFTTDYSSGVVTAHTADGSAISISRATATGVVVSDYWTMRKDDLTAIFGEVTEIEVNKPTEFGNAKNAFSYEYTYTYGGEVYHVYQVLCTTTFNGYVFTYTATEDNYGLHLDEISNICRKVVF